MEEMHDDVEIARFLPVHANRVVPVRAEVARCCAWTAQAGEASHEERVRAAHPCQQHEFIEPGSGAVALVYVWTGLVGLRERADV